MKATMQNLKDNDSKRIMWCPKCGAEYSANKGDYFWAAPDDKFLCCGRVMYLATKCEVITICTA